MRIPNPVTWRREPVSVLSVFCPWPLQHTENGAGTNRHDLANLAALGIAALPTLASGWPAAMQFGLSGSMVIYMLMLILLGSVLDIASIILIAAPHKLP
jgi:hypothetical protein